MNIQSKSRRNFLKASGTAICLAGVGTVKAAKPNKSFASVRTKTKELLKTDVLVVGGGPAGIGAALGSARTGVKTLLIEDYGFFGGVASWCMGMPLNQMRPNRQPRSDVHELIIEKLLSYGKQAIKIGPHQLFCNVDYLKVAVLDALEHVNCKYLVHTRAVDTLVKGNRVTGVVVATKQGLANIRAKVVIDCTGDADAAFFAGAETMKEVNNLSPMTLCFNTANITQKQARKSRRIIKKNLARAREKYPLIPSKYGLKPVSNCSHFFTNHPGTKDLGQFDATDPFQRSKAECLSRRQVLQMVETMREFGGEELKDVELVGTGTQMGVRETRRVKGSYILTEEDAKAGRKFDDVIAWRSGHLDIGFVRMERMKIHDVPYRAIVPEKLDSLLMAGRCISATHAGASAGKSMGNCVATGHAAGQAAAICVGKNIVPREIKIAKLQDAIRSDGVDLSRGGESQEYLSK